MDREKLLKYVLPVVCIVWCIGLFFMGWKTILWTCIGVAIGIIIKQLNNVSYCLKFFVPF